MSREEALSLVKSWTSNPGLIKHMLCVEAAMHALAVHFNEDPELWGIAGLLHDADYEAHPDLHPYFLIPKLEQDGVDEQIVDAIKAHAWGYSEQSQEPQNKMQWSLYTCDELTGLIVASALVRPDKKLASVTVDSVIKKFPDKGFARGVHREHILLCEEKLGLKLPEFVDICLKALQGISSDLGL